MTEPTPAGRQLAADLANAEGCKIPYFTADFVGERSDSLKRALARLATQSIQRDAELAEAKAGLREAHKIAHVATGGDYGSKDHRLDLIADLTDKHRETDPLVEAFQRMPATFDAQIWADTARKTFADLGYELAKRGIELKGVGDGD